MADFVRSVIQSVCVVFHFEPDLSCDLAPSAVREKPHVGCWYFTAHGERAVGAGGADSRARRESFRKVMLMWRSREQPWQGRKAVCLTRALVEVDLAGR